MWERLCKRAQEGKNREPEDRELERTYTTNTIRDSTCDPTTQRRRDQRHTTDQSGFRFINAEDRNERWNSQREHLHIKSIKPPAAKARPEGFSFERRYLPIPLKHVLSPESMHIPRRLSA